MDDHNEQSQATAHALERLVQAEALIREARSILASALVEQDEIPYMDLKTAGRVRTLGEVAHRHLALIEENGSITRAESLRIRREMYGDEVQSTANLFGKRNSGALFWRDRPTGSPVRDTDPICLTDEGVRIATLWRAVHHMY
ncbi:MAG: hypothetical protein JWM89_3509 [Acidimicrobiales bacterium]|nr:hypothetical protein [Acidimicrobiales bacterium]